MKKTIHTVLGDISPDELGTTLMHEHICCADWSMRANFGSRFCDTGRILTRAAEQVGRAQAQGVRTMVDGTAINLGRDIHLLRQVAQDTGIQLIASSGFYAQDEPWLEGQDPGYLFDLLDYECKEGIAGTDSRPGMIKCAVGSEGITPTRRKILSLTARVAAANDLPVFCHHDPAAKTGPEILLILSHHGVDPRRVILGHTGDTNDLDYVRDLLQTGCYIGDDRCAYDGLFNAVENRVRNLALLCDQGYQDQLLLSHDLCVYLGFWEPMETTLSNPDLYGQADFTYLFRQVFPALAQYGFTQEDTRRFLTDNPRAFFSY